MYLFGSFLLLSFCFFFSLSLSIFFSFYRWFSLLVQVKQNRLGFDRVFITMGKGEGMYNTGEGRGLNKYG